MVKRLKRGDILKSFCLAALVAAVLPAAALQAQADPAPLFGARESIQDISLSPDGAKVAFLAPATGAGMALVVADVTGATPPARILTLDGDPEKLDWCGWVSTARLVCGVHATTDAVGVLATVWRLIAIDADGGNVKRLTAGSNSRALEFDWQGGDVLDWLPDSNGEVLMTRAIIPEYSTGTHLANTAEGLAVERVDTRTLTRKRVEPPRRDAVEFITDGNGTVRVVGTRASDSDSGYAANMIRYFYRPKDASGWKPLSTVSAVNKEGFDPVAVDRDLDLVYGFGRKDGRRALLSLSLDGNMTEKLVFAHPEVDVAGLMRIGRRHRVVGVTYVTDKRQAEFFDPPLKALAKSLSKALPGLPLVRFIDSSLDEDKLLLWAGSDVDPGRYYLFDKTSKKLNEILLSRNELEGVTLAPVKPISYRAADGTMIPGYLTLPPGAVAGQKVPGIVMPHGGPGARDEWGFDWLSQYFAARGYAVLQPNFRGSTGYGDAWFQKNGFQSWRIAIGDVNDGARWLASDGISEPGKVAIVGWSYGGYAALQGALVEPDLYRAVVAIAPVTDLEAMRSMARHYTNFPAVDAFIGTGPHVKTGSPAQNAEKMKPPVLMFHGDMDLNVDVGQSRLMAAKLRDAGKKAELVIYPKLDHYLEDSKVRAEMLGKSDAFLRGAMGL